MTPENPEDYGTDIPAPDGGLLMTSAQLAAFVREQLAAEREALQKAHNAEIAGLKAQVTALAASVAGTVPITIPEHAAGAGLELAQTWSQWEQERSYAAHERTLYGTPA